MTHNFEQDNTAQMSNLNAAVLKENSSSQPTSQGSTADYTAEQKATNMRRTTVDTLGRTLQYGLRQPHQRVKPKLPLRQVGSVEVSLSRAAAPDDGSSARWKPAIKEASVQCSLASLYHLSWCHHHRRWLPNRVPQQQSAIGKKVRHIQQ